MAHQCYQQLIPFFRIAGSLEAFAHAFPEGGLVGKAYSKSDTPHSRAGNLQTTAGGARGSKGRLQVQAAQATVGMARRRAEVGLGTLDRLPAHLGVLESAQQTQHLRSQQGFPGIFRTLLFPTQALLQGRYQVCDESLQFPHPNLRRKHWK